MSYEYKSDDVIAWEQSLLQMYDEGTAKGDKIRQVWNKHNITKMNHKQKKAHNEALQSLQKEAPPKALGLMMSLQQAVDDEDMEAITNLVFNVDDDNNLMSVITDFIAICNESDIAPIKRSNVVMKERLTRAEILARASDPRCSEYSFCPRCSRPMATSWIPKHMAETQICREIKTGRKSAIKHKDYKHPDIIRDVAFGLIDDSDEES